MLSADELARWLRDMLGVLRRRVGAHVQHQPFYPGFPEQVLKASKAELYLTAVMRTSRCAACRREHARPPLLEGKLVPWLVELGSVAEFESLLAPLVSSRTSLSEWTPPMSPGSSGSTVAMSSACCPGRAVPRDPRAGWRRAGPARGGRCAGGRIPGSQRRDRDRRAAAGGGPERRGCVADHGDDTLRADEARRAPPAAAPARSRTQRRGRRDAPRRTLEAPWPKCCTRATTPTNTRAPWRPSRRRGATTRRPRSGRASRRCWPNGTSPRSRPCCNNVPANSRAGWT